MNSIRKYSTYLIISFLLFTLLIYSGFRYLNYESPEDCFVRKMAEWADGNLDKIQPIIKESDSILSVSSAKAYLTETSRENDPKKMRYQLKVYLDYCGAN